MAGGTDFLLEIATKMNGDDAVSELAKIGNSIAEGKTKFQELERASANAAKGLERVGQQMTETRDKMSKAMAAGDQKAFWKLAEAADKLEKKEKDLKTAAAAATTALDAQARSLSKLADEYGDLRRAESKMRGPIDVEKTAAGVKKLGGPLGGLANTVEDVSESWAALSSNLGRGGAIAAVAAVGVVTLGAALVAGAAAAAAFSLKMADQQRDLALTLEAMQRMGGVGDDLKGTFDGVTDATGVGSARLIELTEELKAAKIGADQLPDALRAIAMQEKALNSQKGTGDLIEQLKDGKTTAAAMADEMDRKFGDLVDKKMLGLDSAIARITTNIERMFDGADIEGILRGISRLVDLLDGSTESGKALKTIFGSLFGGLGDGESVFIAIEGAIIDCEIAALDFLIGLKKIEKVTGLDLASFEEFPDLALVGQVAAASMAGAVVACSVAMQGLAFGAKAAGVALSFVASSATNMGKGLKLVWDTVSSGAKTAIASLSTIGSQMIDGLVKGITDNAEKVSKALLAPIKSAIASAVEFLEIGSPSKLTGRIAGFTAQGWVNELEDWTPAANDAFLEMTAPPKDIERQYDDIAPREDMRATGKSSAAPIVHITATYNITGGDPEETRRQVEEAHRELVSGMAEQLGARRRGKRRAA